jgi:hypothetical protein
MPTRDAPSQLKVGLVVLVSLVMGGLVLAHLRWVNGPWYWYWSWRRLPALPLYASMLAASTPFFAAHWLCARKLISRRMTLLLFMLATMLLQLAASANQPPYGLDRLVGIVQNTVNTSYYEAAKWVKDEEPAAWLGAYPQVLTDYFKLLVHARFKPPGQVLYYLLMIQLFGVGKTAALVGGLLVGAIGTLSVPACDWLVRFYARDDRAGLCAAGFMALTPSLVLFFPQFDQTYPAITCLLLVLWGRALAHGKFGDSLGFGIALAGALFLSSIFLIVGLFLATLSLLHIGQHGRSGVRRLASQSLLAVLGIGLFYGLVHAWSGYDPIATFLTISELQAADLVHLSRPFPLHIVFDVYDVLLGVGWIGGLLIAYYVAGSWRSLVAVFRHDPPTRLAFLSLLQVGTVAAAALLPGEAARLWLPLFPLLMVPIGLELSRWPLRHQIAAYVCLLAMTILIAQNMTFIYMGPDLDGPRWEGWESAQ